MIDDGRCGLERKRERERELVPSLLKVALWEEQYGVRQRERLGALGLVIYAVLLAVLVVAVYGPVTVVSWLARIW